MIKNYNEFLNESESVGTKFDNGFRGFVSDLIYEYPKQTPSLSNAVDKKEQINSFVLSFSEEVKDGRSSRFNTNDINKLRNKTFSLDGIILKINDVNLKDTDVDPCGYSTYYYYYFNVTCEITYAK